MSKTIHFCIDLDFLRETTMKGVRVLDNPITGEPLTELEIYELIRIEKEVGHTVYCPCNNRDQFGKCAGHFE